MSQEQILTNISVKEASEAVQDFVNEIFESGECRLVSPTDSEITAASKILGIEFPNDNFHIVEGVFLKANKKNRNGHFLSGETVQEGLQSLPFTPVNLNHQFNHPIGFYMSASFNSVTSQVTTRALIWKHRFPQEVATIEQWIEEGDAGQSFELTFGKRALRRDTGAIELENVTFRGGAILRRSRAAEPASSADITAAFKECSIVYGGIETMASLGESISEDEKAKLARVKENLDDDAKIARHSLNTVETLLMEAQCPTCGGKYNDVVSLDVENETALMRCSNSGCASFHTPESRRRQRKKEQEGGVFTVNYSLKTATIESQEEVSMSEKTKNEDKTFTQAEVDEMKADAVAEAIKKHDLIKERRAELGDVAKDSKDADLLNDSVFSSLQKDKQIADLEAENKTLKEKVKASDESSEQAEEDESKESDESEEAESDEAGAAEGSLLTGGGMPQKGSNPVVERMGEVITRAKR